LLDQKLKAKYSRLYSVFVAWKFYVKEKLLLNKYLSECNYQSQNSKSLKSRGASLPSYKQNKGSFKENLAGLTDSNHGMKAQRIQNEQQRKVLETLG